MTNSSKKRLIGNYRSAMDQLADDYPDEVADIEDHHLWLSDQNARFRRERREAQELAGLDFVSTETELAALPDGAVILDREGDVTQRRGGGWCGYETNRMSDHYMGRFLPAAILHIPQSNEKEDLMKDNHHGYVGWRCTREKLHAGPCALIPRWWNWLAWSRYVR